MKNHIVVCVCQPSDACAQSDNFIRTLLVEDGSDLPQQVEKCLVVDSEQVGPGTVTDQLIRNAMVDPIMHNALDRLLKEAFLMGGRSDGV